KSCYKRADHQYALTFAFTTDSSRAGVLFVRKKGNQKLGIRPKIDRINPFDGLDRLRALTLEDDLREGKTGPVTACFRACYQGMSRIMRNNLLDGAVLAHEIAWHFVRGGKFSPYVKPNA